MPLKKSGSLQAFFWSQTPWQGLPWRSSVYAHHFS